MNINLTQVLQRSELLKGLKDSEIEFFLTNNSYKIKEYTKNDILAIAGNRVDHLMIVLQGTLIARMVSDSGKFIQIDKIDAGRVVAPAMLFATDNIFPVNVIPDEDTTVFYMHRDVFSKALNTNNTLLLNFIRIISDINRFLSKKIHSLSLKSIRGKLAEYILQVSQQQGASDAVILTLTRQELADKFAVTRQALSRSLSELEEEGLIEIKTKKIVIKNRVALRGID